MDVFVARQAIFDRQLKVQGYELLARSCLDGVSAHAKSRRKNNFTDWVR
jgi:c-di-GMP-related signal transduction protein